MKHCLHRLMPYAKYALLVLGVAFVALGTLRAEHLEVLQKAVNICLECIGVG